MGSEAYHSLAEKGAQNANAETLKILHQSIMGGCYVGFGGTLSIMISGSIPGIAASNPGLQKLLFAALFPMNLLLILNTGGQLFTGNAAAVPAAYFEGLVVVDAILRSWALSFRQCDRLCGFRRARHILRSEHGRPS